MSFTTYSMKGRHLGSIRDLDPEEFMRVLHTARDLKNRSLTGERPPILQGRTLAMVFEKPSLRTVVSFEVAMNHLGGHALYLGPDQISLGKRETVEDIAEVLSGFVDGIMARVFAHAHIQELIKYSKVPVINGLCDYEHPCQILGDFLTIWERKGCLKGRKLVYVGDGNNVANSLAFACARLGMHMVCAGPEGYELKPRVLETCAQDALDFCSGGSVIQLHDPAAAIKDADIVYTDVWASMGQEAEAAHRKKIFAPYTVSRALIDKAKPDVMVLHCLPAHYGDEIEAGLQRDPRSAIYPQAENRLNAQKAVLAMLLR